MSIKPHKKYLNTWIIEYYPEGRRKDPKTGKANTKRKTVAISGSESDARAYYAELLKKAGKAPRVAPTISEIINEYLIYYSNKNCPGTLTDWRNAWRNLKPWFNHLRPAQLTPALIENYKASRTAVKPRTIDKEITYLRGIINWMVENNYCDALTFKIKGYPRNKTRAPATMVPTEDQLTKVLDNLIQPQRDIFKVMYLCGLRRNEVLRLTVERVHLAAGYILVMGKGNKERIVPLSDEAREILERNIEGKNGPEYIWINPHTKRPFVELGYALKRAAVRAGVNLRVYPHLMRHSTFTHLAQHNASAFQIQALAGHSDIETSQGYVTLAMQGLAELISKISKK